MKITIHIIILILFSTLLTAQNVVSPSNKYSWISSNNTIPKFIQKLREDIAGNKYSWIKDKNKIPKFVYSYIQNFKRENTNIEGESEFDIANSNEDYNSGCYIRPNLPYRKLWLAGSNGTEWIIFYAHGQGRVNNNKILHIDIKKRNIISLFGGCYANTLNPTDKEIEQLILCGLKTDYLLLFRGSYWKTDIKEF